MNADANEEKQEAVDGLSNMEVRREPTSSRSHLAWYVAALLISPFLVIVFSLLWMRSDDYARHSDSSYVQQLGYGLALHGADCQILIYGDSTALVGADPHEIQRRTGLSTCNIAEYAGLELINGNVILDRYLEQNRRPEYLIFSYAPENYAHTSRWGTISTIEGLIVRLKLKPASGFLKVFAAHPEGVLTDAEVGLLNGLRSRVKQALPRKKTHSREDNLGRLPDEGPARTDCQGDAPRQLPDLQWMKHLRTTYGVAGTHVLLDVTPMPQCDATLSFYEKAFPAKSVDGGFVTMPLNLFSGSGRLHATPAGANFISNRIADQVMALRKAGS